MIEDEEFTARLLRLAGPRPLVPADSAARVRDTVREHWRAATRRRIVRRRVTVALAMLAALGVTSTVALIRRGGVASPPPEVVAHVERVEGAFPLASGSTMREREWMETSAAARVALRLTDGTSVRLDSASRMRLLSPAVIELVHGGMYIDTGRMAAALEVRTVFGTVRDIGTQFETRLAAGSLRLRVRTGLVEFRRGSGEPLTARAGTELTVKGGETTSRPISGHGTEWAWVAALAPRFEIEGRSVAAFLEHISREQGWSLRYADAALARDASSIILHGSVTGLDAEDALAAALATSDLGHRVRDGELVVSRRMEQEP
jgi:ferric-dicitrate binding protein FerR (iron transport regulator)